MLWLWHFIGDIFPSYVVKVYSFFLTLITHLRRHIVGMSENFYRVKKSTRMYVFKQFFFFFYLSAQFFPFGFRWVSCTFNDLFRKSLRISNVFVQHYFSLKEKITVSAVSNDFFLLSSVVSFFFYMEWHYD